VSAQPGDFDGFSVTRNSEKLMVDGQGGLGLFYTLQGYTIQTILIQSGTAVIVAGLMRDSDSGRVDQLSARRRSLHAPPMIGSHPPQGPLGSISGSYLNIPSWAILFSVFSSFSVDGNQPHSRNSRIWNESRN